MTAVHRNSEENTYEWTLTANECSVLWFLANKIITRHDYTPHGTNLLNSLCFPLLFTSTDIKYPKVKSKEDGYISPHPSSIIRLYVHLEFEIKFSFCNKAFSTFAEALIYDLRETTCSDQLYCFEWSTAKPCHRFMIVVICGRLYTTQRQLHVHNWII